MSKLQTFRAAHRRAFTLIELLVVIVILGILMAVALPTFLSQQNKAKDSEAQQYLTTAYSAMRSEAKNVSFRPGIGIRSDAMPNATLTTASHVDELLSRAAALNIAGECAAARSVLTDALAQAGALAQEHETALAVADVQIRSAFKHGQTLTRARDDRRLDFYPEFSA